MRPRVTLLTLLLLSFAAASFAKLAVSDARDVIHVAPVLSASSSSTIAAGGDADHRLLAWLETLNGAQRVRVAALDASLAAQKSVTLPAFDPSLRSIADTPAVGFNGSSYFVAWHEVSAAKTLVVGLRVDLDGTPLDAMPIAINVFYAGYTVSPPQVFSVDGEFAVASGGGVSWITSGGVKRSVASGVPAIGTFDGGTAALRGYELVLVQQTHLPLSCHGFSPPFFNCNEQGWDVRTTVVDPLHIRTTNTIAAPKQPYVSLTAAGGSEGFVLIWRDLATRTLRAQHLGNDGVADGPFNVIANLRSPYAMPAQVVPFGNGWLAAWIDDGDPIAPANVVVRTLDATANANDAAVIVASDYGVSSPALLQTRNRVIVFYRTGEGVEARELSTAKTLRRR